MKVEKQILLVVDSLDRGSTTRTVSTNLPKPLSVILAFLKNISPHFAYPYLTVMSATNHRKEHLENCTIILCDKRKENMCDQICLS